MVLEIPKKPLEGVWWKYGLALAALHLLAWVALGYKVNPEFAPLLAAARSYTILVTFAVAAFLPFVAGRLALKRLMWCALIGYALGTISYFLLGLYEPVRTLNTLLPFIAFVQVNILMISLGALVEFGHYVYRKVFEE